MLWKRARDAESGEDSSGATRIAKMIRLGLLVKWGCFADNPVMQTVSH
jgi:hypothetical protein